MNTTHNETQQQKRRTYFNLPKGYDWKTDIFCLKWVYAEAKHDLFKVEEIEECLLDDDFSSFFNHHIDEIFNWNRETDKYTSDEVGFKVVLLNGDDLERGIPKFEDALRIGFEEMEISDLLRVIENNFEDDGYLDLLVSYLKGGL